MFILNKMEGPKLLFRITSDFFFAFHDGLISYTSQGGDPACFGLNFGCLLAPGMVPGWVLKLPYPHFLSLVNYVIIDSQYFMLKANNLHKIDESY